MSHLTDSLATLNDGELLAQFARTRSQEAFSAIVSRHGGLVIGVCRRVLGNAHGAEDAAQAVFLTLAQKAGELSGRESAAGWLHKVAWHVAMRAREAAAIRSKHEQEVAEMKSHEAPREATWDDLRPVLDEELAALPEKYRVPLVLHHLEGRTIEEAAKLMNCSSGTMASWISRGREQLRVRLAKRKLELPAATLPVLMAMGVGVSLTFIASTAKAASLLAEGNAAAGGMVSAQATALFKGTMKMMMLSKLRAAAVLLLLAMLPLLAAMSVYYFTGQAEAANPENPQAGPQAGGPQLLGNGGNPGGGATEKITSTAWPLNITVVDSQHRHSEAMHRTINVSYRRAYVSEVVSDLERRTGVRVAYAQPLGDGWTFSMEAKGVDAKQVLEKLAADGKFDLAEQQDLEVLSQKADDKVISELTKQLGSADRWDRANAVWGLGNLADLRIYPLLTVALGDPDVGVREWAMRALEKHSRMASVMDDQGKDAIIKTVGAWLKSIRDTTDYKLTGYAWATWGNLAAGDRKDRLELLAATRKPESRAILFDTLRTVKNKEGAMRYIVREATVKALKADPETATEALTLLPMYDALVAEDAKLPPGRGWMPNQEINLKLEVIKDLLSFEIPEIQQTVQAILNKTPRSFFDEQVVALVVKDYPLNMDFHELAKQKIVGLDALYKAVETNQPDNGKGGPTLMGPLPGFQAIQALKLLDLIPDPEVTKALLKLVKDEKAMAIIDKASGWATDVALPLDDPEIVAALQARLSLKQAGGQLAARSLGHSHDPKIADALIAQLKDSDDAWVATAAEAVAQTRDPRALAALVSTVRDKRDWSDFEADDKADAKDGIQMQTRTNPHKLMVRAIPDTRDPGELKELAAMAVDPNLDEEVQLTAQQQLRGTPATQADMDTLMDMLKGANAKVQREVFLGGLPNSAMPFIMGVYTPPVNPTQYFINDPRMLTLWCSRIIDDETELRATGPVRQLMRNTMIDLAQSFSSPAAEKTLLDQCKNPNEHVAFFAARGLGRFQDPKITIEYTQ